MRVLFACILSFISFYVSAQSPLPKSPPEFSVADSFFLKGDWGSALTEFHKALIKNPNPPAPTLYKIGVTQQMLNKFDDALTTYDRVLTILGSNPFAQKNNIFINKALIFAQQGNKEAALVQLRIASDSGYTNTGLQLANFSDFATIKETEEFKNILNSVRLNAMPCYKNPRNSEFDFWLGKWEVYSTRLKHRAGTSTVQKIAGGCALLENWHPWGGYPEAGGKSFNFINTKTNKWEQVWIGGLNSASITHYVNGEYKNGKMMFEIKGISSTDNQPYIGRFSFFNEGPNQVRQLYETTVDNGKNWVTGYDLTYKRIQE